MYKFILVLFLFSCIDSYAQEKPKKPLTFNDFASWNTLADPQISENGNIITYEVNPQKGNGKLIIYHSEKSDTINRGAGAKIGPGNNFVVFKIKQPEETIRKAKLDKVKKDDMPADSVGIFVLKQDSIVAFAELKSFKIPEESNGWIALLLKHTEKKDTTETGNGKSKKEQIKQPGDDLVLFNVTNADTVVFRNVTDYYYSKKGENVIFVSQTKDSLNTFSTIRLFNTREGNTENLFESEGWVDKVVADNFGSQYTFLHSTDTTKGKVYKLYYGVVDQLAADVVVDNYTSGMPIGWSPSPNGDISFSDDGLKLYFGTAESPEPEPKDTLLDEEKPKLDVWNWKDQVLQPQQIVNLEKEQKRTYVAVYHTDLKRFIQLADLNIKTVSTIQKGNGEIALGSDDTPYLRASSWTGEQNRDYYLVDTKTGIKRRMVLDKSLVRLSPGGKFIIWYENSDSSYYARSTDIEQLEKIPLTKIIPVSFYNELNDTPSDPRPYGIAGWAEGDRFVFIYDRYDIWKIDPMGLRVPVNITKAFGRRNRTRLRYIQFDKDEEFLPIDKPIVLHAFDERTMSSGFFKTILNSVKDPDLLLVDKFSFSTPVKAKNADKVIWTKEDVKTFPDFWLSNLDFKNPEKLSEANPQQPEFNWLTVELVEWASFSGETLKGLLYKPENFNPTKKYPMIVYFYERNSETLNQHSIPAPIRSVLNKTFMVSNGYLFFIPDITYKTGYPGQSAFNAVVSGTSYLINKYPFIDKGHIGLQGHSWGGYQILYLITQTDMFAAAEAGAPVSNMTSAYGGIRWETGLSRMFQYEHTQSRIGGTLWEKPLLYIENSPLFHAPKIYTPLLMMHNDNDGAVPWYQGIEMFVALRRLNKPAWLLNYNGENHGLGANSWANKMDFAERMFQFFNHYLKGQPVPEWMEKGIPAIEKGKNLGFE